MPVVTRADCTETVVTNEEVDVAYIDGYLKANVSFDIDFQSCDGPNENNDLEDYYVRLKEEGKASQDDLDNIRTHLVGDCSDSIANFLETQGLQRTSTSYSDTI